MALAPTLDSADFVFSTEEVAVAIFAQPPSLAGGLTGPLARAQGTIALTVLSARVGRK